jgi:dUTP pyrophosphatase
MELQIKKLDAAAKIPTYAHADDAGMDLYALAGVTIEPGERTIIKTGIAMAIPSGHVGLIWDKSSVPVKKGVTTLAGVVDAQYRGEIGVVVYNTDREPQSFVAGEKVAQMVIQAVMNPQVTEVHELDETERGDGGYGSTGST